MTRRAYDLNHVPKNFQTDVGTLKYLDSFHVTLRTKVTELLLPLRASKKKIFHCYMSCENDFIYYTAELILRNLNWSTEKLDIALPGLQC